MRLLSWPGARHHKRIEHQRQRGDFGREPLEPRLDGGDLRVLMAEAQINEEFGQLFRSAFLQRRRDALQVVLDRARTRGDLPPRPAASTVLDIVFGTLWYRLLATRQPMGDDLVEDLTATLTQAAQPPTDTAIDLGDQQ